MASKTNAVRLVQQAGFSCIEKTYDYDENDLNGNHAAEAIGYPPEQVFKTLVTKGILDFIIIAVMTCSLGKGCIFSAIPVLFWQGSITLLAGFIKPVMTDSALANLSLVGSILIFCVGVNLVWGKKIRVANLLPSIFIAVAIAFLPY